MPLRAARLLVWPFAVTAFALRACAELWFRPLTWRIDPSDAAFVAWVAVLSGTLLVPLAVYALLTRSTWRRPMIWQVDTKKRRFVAPANPTWIGQWSITLGWLAAAFVQTERVVGEDRVRLVQTTGTVALAIAVAAVVLGGIATTLLLNRPLLALDPDGITTQGLVRRTALRWDRLHPGSPPVANPPPARRLHVDPVFLANTVRHYVEHPEHRPAIGTQRELDRLCRTLT
ncbi:hypothetical protein ACLQ28_23005 [Micromonospora sp. DT201]|uniref:hypothetical protein n=1 Tax=Micromonospora sp. DT201 TaxID=3393442 RepID=UPI003CF34783